MFGLLMLSWYKKNLFSIILIFAFIFSFAFFKNDAHASKLTPQQVQAILDLLKSFSAPDTVIERVKLALEGKKIFYSTTYTCPSFTRSLYKGKVGEDVKELQKLLKRLGYFNYPEFTNYFGNVTRAALRAFQCERMQICSGDELTTGYGVLGPRTRQAISQACTELSQQEQDFQDNTDDKTDNTDNTDETDTYTTYTGGGYNPYTPQCINVLHEHTEGDLCTLDDGQTGYWHYVQPSNACPFWECVGYDMYLKANPASGYAPLTVAFVFPESPYCESVSAQQSIERYIEFKDNTKQKIDLCTDNVSYTYDKAGTYTARLIRVISSGQNQTELELASTTVFVDKKNQSKYENFIKAVYQLILDREPSEDTIAKYTEEFKFENKHWGGYDNAYDPDTAVALQMIWSLFNSKEFKNNYGDVNTLSDKEVIKLFYKTILNREPSKEGLDKYLQMLKDGWHRREIMRRILMSKESQKKNPELFAEDILKETYRDVNTAGPYIGKNFDASKLTSFSSDDKLVMTYFFTWYDVYSGEHVYTDLDKVLPQYRDKVAFTYNGKKVASIMTTHPSTHPHYNNPPFTVKSKEWWKKELKDMHDAGVDIAILSGLWHFPAKHTKGNRTALLLEPLNQALRELDREGVHMKVAMQWSTGKAGKNNIFFRDFDLTKKPQQEFFYKSIRDFYSRIDPKFWALIDGKVVVNTWIPKYFSNYDQEVFDYSEKQFTKDFGGKKIWWILGNSRLYSKSTVWKASVLPKADRSFWGAHTSPHAAWFSDKVVQVSPGFDKSHAATVLTGAIKPPRIIPRQNGNFYRKGWEKIFKNKKVRRVMIETWNEYHEGRDISDSYEYGRKYIKLTREFVNKWKQKK